MEREGFSSGVGGRCPQRSSPPVASPASVGCFELQSTAACQGE